MNWRFWRRGPSPALKAAEEAHRDIRSRSEEVEKVTSSLRKMRERNGLAPLIQEMIQRTR
jgi:hypothetical protein